MHQQSRATPRMNVPASVPHPSTLRSGTPREVAFPDRPRAGSNVSGNQPTVSPTTEVSRSLEIPAESVKKLDQIVQNFHTKAAALILGSRMEVKPIRNANGTPKVNKWYQIETDEIDDFRDELKTWKTCGSLQNLPPPMIIDVYLDTSTLKDSQSLVIVDEDGKRWDVMEQLQSSRSNAGSTPPVPTNKYTEVLLERWRVDLKATAPIPTEDFGATLPTIYKKAIVFFRSLFITTRLLPAWRFTSQGMKGCHPALSPRCRIRAFEPRDSSPDPLKSSIDGKSDPVTEYMFGDLEVPIGRLSTCVVYRNDCSFRIDDSESLLSSRFMGVDENFFKPSMPQRSETDRPLSTEIGSMRDYQSRRPNLTDQHQTYGSLSTFHGNNPMSTSPLSALKAVKSPGSDTSSPPASLPPSTDFEAPHSLPIGRQISSTRPGFRVGDEHGRRPSISFQPFKAGSLSGSPIPRQAELESPSTQSLVRPASLQGAQPRNRSSLTAGMPASLRGGPPAQPTAESPVIGSPRPSSSSRYSSSFTHRRGRLSIGGGKTGDDEQNSSGRQSLASSLAQPGSGLLAEPSAASSGSLPGEEDNISEFLKALDSKKTLKSFEPAKRGEAATNRTVAQLSRFHLMRESNNALTDSMTSSMQMQRSSSSSSRQLTSVPSMVAPASLSTSSSPGKPLSPHTPHTPAVPSRLSENSTAITSPGSTRTAQRSGRSQMPTVPEPGRPDDTTQDGATAIDIPLSPRLGTYQRRSSSVAQQSRVALEDDEPDLAFANRSISLGADDREAPTLSVLLGRQRQLGEDSTVRESTSEQLQPAADMQTTSTSSSTADRGLADDNPPDGLLGSVQSSSPVPRRRYTGMGVRARQTPPQTYRGNFGGSATSRIGRADEDNMTEEPLVFDLSEMDAQSRRSLEESRGGISGTTTTDKPSFEAHGTSRRGW